MIQCQFSVDKQEEAEYVQVIGWNLAAMSIEDEKPAEKVWKALVGQRDHLDEECMGDEVQREAL